VTLDAGRSRPARQGNGRSRRDQTQGFSEWS
jgi:hypothetical protein